MRPDFLAVLGVLEGRREGAEVGAQIEHITLEHFGGVAVARRVDGLRQVDDDRPALADEDVVFGEVAVNDAGAQHAHHLIHEQGVIRQRQFLAEFDIVQARRRMAVGIEHQIHQQHAGEAEVRLRHPHASGGQPIQGIDLGTLPDLFLHPAPIAAAFLHGTRLAAVLHLAAFLIGGVLAETALIGFLVDFGAANRFAAANDIDGGLLAAHQLANHLIDEAFFDECGESVRGFHGGLEWGADWGLPSRTARRRVVRSA